MALPKLLILNGSVSGARGNCGRLIKYLQKHYRQQFKIEVVHLKTSSRTQTRRRLQQAEALLVVSGTYWESWGSPLQKFLEDFTDYEVTDLFLGKPLGCVVLAHAVGAKSIISRLQANFNLLGCALPPLTGVELSLVAQEVVRQQPTSPQAQDLWSINDLDIVVANLAAALTGQPYQAWSVDRKNFRKLWLKTN